VPARDGSAASGLALLRARHLDAEAHQLTLWDGLPATGVAGTAADVASWSATGRDVVVVTPGPTPAPDEIPGGGGHRHRRPSTAPAPERVVRAMLMGDIRGFSKLTDGQLRAFTPVVLGAFAEVLSSYGADIEYRTWGDGLFTVVSDATVAAACALDLQDAIQTVDLAGAGLPSHLALRLSGHVGPIFPIQDPVTESWSFTGSHVSRTARIEPGTPPGAVYVTEAFAADLELAGDGGIGCDYVGHLPAAKDFGRLRTYRIWRRRSPSDGAAPDGGRL
jgi:adenylate cyclase